MGLRGIKVAEDQTSRRDVVKSLVAGAAALGPLAVLGACSENLGSSTALSVVPRLASASFVTQAATATLGELDYWSSAIGQTFRITGPEGPMTATLSAVTPLAIVGERPDELRAQPMIATFALARSERPLGDRIYALVQGRERESELFLQRGGTADAPTLSALFN